MGIGGDWPFEPLGYRECLLHSDFKIIGHLSVGDLFYTGGRAPNNQMEPIFDYYNSIAESNGWTKKTDLPSNQDHTDWTGGIR